MRKWIDSKKGLLLALSLLALNASSFALSLSFKFKEKPIHQGSLEFFYGSYDMNEPRFDNVYSAGGGMSGLALSSAIVSNVNFYLEVKYYVRRGELTFTKEKTEFTLVPISLGVRYIVPLGLFNPYIGGGGDFYLYYEDNPIGTVLNYTNGYHLTWGIYFHFFKKVPLLLNVKFKYTTAKATAESAKLQLGGFEYAAGLAFTF